MIGPKEAALRAQREARVTEKPLRKPTVTEMRKTISVTGKRGRPSKPDALSNADRQRAFRERRKSK